MRNEHASRTANVHQIFIIVIASLIHKVKGCMSALHRLLYTSSIPENQKKGMTMRYSCRPNCVLNCTHLVEAITSSMALLDSTLPTAQWILYPEVLVEVQYVCGVDRVSDR